MTKEDYRTLHEAIDTYGSESQIKMVLEEMSELQKEICKFWRGEDNKDQIADEVADLEIVLAQLKLIFGIEADVDDHRVRKLKRLSERLRSTE